MRPVRHLCWALGIALVCGCAQKTSESSVSTSDTTGTALRAQSESEISLHLAQTRAHIDSLREEASRVGAKMDAALAAKLAQVEAERDTAQRQLGRLQQATRNEWNDLKFGLTTAIDSLDSKIDRLRAGMPRRKP